MINKVICVCTIGDIATFEKCATNVQRYIAANRYTVIVPESDLKAFNDLNLGAFEVHSEEKYSHIANYLKIKMGKKNERFGWYFQQFIKLSELSEGGSDDVNLIWDADTVPIKRLNFLVEGKLFYYQGREFHKPYFDMIQKLIKSSKLSEHSFIAQCFPCRVNWVNAFMKELEKIQGDASWYQSIINLIDLKENSGFSEYEALGTFILRDFHDDVIISKVTNNWYRFGNSLIGGCENISDNLHWLSRRFDYLSFEKWDKTKIRTLRRIKIRYLGY